MAVKIGWCNTPTPWSDLLPFEPEQLRVDIRCPVIAAWASQSFVVKAPFDLGVQFTHGPDGAELKWIKEYDFKIEPRQVVPFTKQKLWRKPNQPSVQWTINNLFVADEPVWMETWSPFFHFRKNPLPGVIVPSRHNIHEWAKPVPWVFEWHDISKPLVIKRGEPIQYVRFHTPNNDETFKIVRLEYTEELEKAVERAASLTPFKKNFFSLGKALLGHRPKRWLP